MEMISSQIWFWAVSCRGKVAQAGVAGISDAVFAAGPSAVTEFEIGELAACHVGREAGQPPPVDVGEAQLGAGVRPFLADDQPHARGAGCSGRGCR